MFTLSWKSSPESFGTHTVHTDDPFDKMASLEDEGKIIVGFEFDGRI